MEGFNGRVHMPGAAGLGRHENPDPITLSALARIHDARCQQELPLTSAENAVRMTRRPSLLAAVRRLAVSPRLYVYLSCALLAVMTSYHLGKDMGWDTLDYHLYLGFSGLHDRFGQDYFASGSQAYFNPYALAPFYLLVTSGLTALQAASVLALIQSAILWLTYELAMIVAPKDGPRVRIAFGICAVALAALNPVLLNQFGSSATDITTAEIVLGGWLLLAGAIRTPSAARVAFAGLILGCAAALKLTNSFHAVSAGVLLFFLPMGWSRKLRHGALFVAAGVVGFVIIAAPWSVRLVQHFGNPMFPLLNGLFRSPEFFTSQTMDYRFVPTSLGVALSRPFEMVLPINLVQVEWAAPDARYALFLALAIAFLVAGAWKYLRENKMRAERPQGPSSGRVLLALGCGFLVDWMLWLRESANGRYFIPAACIVAVLCVAVIFQLFSARPRVRNYLLAGVFLVQAFQLHAGTQYPERLPWTDRPWFDVSVPQPLASRSALYFNIGVQSYAFLAPFLAPGSGFVNLDGDYTLGPDGANGAEIAGLIRKYSPHLRILVRDTRGDPARHHDVAGVDAINDALMPFGLQVVPTRCVRIVVHDMPPPSLVMIAGPLASQSAMNEGYFVSCAVIPGNPPDAAIVAGAGAANRALDNLEDACPALFQPARPVSALRGSKRRGYVWVRRYENTGLRAWVIWGQVRFQATLGGPEIIAGAEAAWEKAPLHVECGLTEHGYFFRTK